MRPPPPRGPNGGRLTRGNMNARERPCHCADRAARLRTNRRQFTSISLTALTPAQIEAGVATVQDLPAVEGGATALLDALLTEPATTHADAVGAAGNGNASADSGRADPLEQGLLTLSALPKLRWQNLLNLETIRVRRKRTRAPVFPVHAVRTGLTRRALGSVPAARGPASTPSLVASSVRPCSCATSRSSRPRRLKKVQGRNGERGHRVHAHR